MPSVTVAVVSWNTRALLERCLRSLEGLDVWVVDNGSTDGSVELVRSSFGSVTLVERPDNPGFGTAVNLVAAGSSSDFLVVANADVALSPGALDALLAAAERDPGAGAFAPCLVLPDGSVQQSVFPFPSVRGALRCAPLRVPAVEQRVDWAVAAFLLVRRGAWDAVGGFDEAQWMYAEDLDLGWRLARAGWPTRYVPSARVEHESAAATAQAWGEARTERWQAATYAWIAWRRGAARARAIAGVHAGAAAWRAVVSRGAERERWRWWARVHARGLSASRASAAEPHSAAGGRARTPSG